METDRIIASIAAGQHAAVGRRQLLDAGVPAHAKHRVGTGSLITVHAGVYRLAGSPVSWHQRIVSATLAAGAGAVASHRAAAFLHGLEGIEPQLEVSVPRGRAPSSKAVVVHRLDLGRSGTERRDGITRTRPPATIFGLAAVVPIAALEMALDDALLRGLVSCDQLQRRLDGVNRRGRPGMPALAESYRHHAGRIAWSREQTRVAILCSMGWRVIPVTWEDLVGAPRHLVATLQRARAA